MNDKPNPWKIAIASALITAWSSTADAQKPGYPEDIGKKFANFMLKMPGPREMTPEEGHRSVTEYSQEDALLGVETPEATRGTAEVWAHITTRGHEPHIDGPSIPGCTGPVERLGVATYLCHSEHALVDFIVYCDYRRTAALPGRNTCAVHTNVHGYNVDYYVNAKYELDQVKTFDWIADFILTHHP